MNVLGLTFVWIHVPAYHLMLMLTWALTPAAMSTYLKDCRWCLLRAFKCCHAEQVTWPDVGIMTALAGLIAAWQQQLTGVFGFVDGLNLAILQPPNGILQNAYNGWLGRCYCSPSSSSGQTGASCGAP